MCVKILNQVPDGEVLDLPHHVPVKCEVRGVYFSDGFLMIRGGRGIGHQEATYLILFDTFYPKNH